MLDAPISRARETVLPNVYVRAEHRASQWCLRRLHVASWSRNAPVEETLLMMHGVVPALCFAVSPMAYCHYLIIMMTMSIVIIIHC